MPLSDFTVKSRLRDYRVAFQEPGDYLPRLAAASESFFVVDENVWRLHKDGVLKPLCGLPVSVLPISEDLKSLESVRLLYDRIIEKTPKKNMRLVSIGGGITQDITGFAASTLYRGVNWTFIPTTLLAQADSCIGGKTSLNYKNYKNLVGTFYPPSEVCISSSFLPTLKEPDYLSGLGEMAKLAIIGGREPAEAFAGAAEKLLSRDQAALASFLREALEIKKGYIEEDEFDSGRRNILNFGHCFGHALESATDFAVPHGLAVVYGMLLANIVARRRGLLSPASEAFMRGRILLPVLGGRAWDARAGADAVVSNMRKDKKRTGNQLALVMALDDFKMLRVSDLEESEARTAIEELAGEGGGTAG